MLEGAVLLEVFDTRFIHWYICIMIMDPDRLDSTAMRLDPAVLPECHSYAYIGEILDHALHMKSLKLPSGSLIGSDSQLLSFLSIITYSLTVVSVFITERDVE